MSCTDIQKITTFSWECSQAPLTYTQVNKHTCINAHAHNRISAFTRHIRAHSHAFATDQTHADLIHSIQTHAELMHSKTSEITKHLHMEYQHGHVCHLCDFDIYEYQHAKNAKDWCLYDFDIELRAYVSPCKTRHDQYEEFVTTTCITYESACMYACS